LLHTPINTTFRCTLEAIGDYNTPYSAATFLGASFMRPGDENVSSIGISNFFKKVRVCVCESPTSFMRPGDENGAPSASPTLSKRCVCVCVCVSPTSFMRPGDENGAPSASPTLSKRCVCVCESPLSCYHLLVQGFLV